ncbi:MAG: NADPH:quinone reductase, partial [Quisquiliibacterium sp.]
TVPAHKAVPLPDGVGFDVGACMGIPAMTAHRCVFADGPVTDKTVLVQGGAGAVGYYAVQMARLGGAQR